MSFRWKFATALGGWLVMAAIGAAAVEKNADQLRRETLARMSTGHAKLGDTMSYGYGFGVHQGKERRYGHTGGARGISASFEVFPDSGYTVIVLAKDDHGSVALAERLGRTVLQRR